MVRKLAIRLLRRGVGSMDYIHTLLIMEDDLDEPSPDVLSLEYNSSATTVNFSPAPVPSGGQLVVDWCVCEDCRPMPQGIENKCCRLKD